MTSLPATVPQLFLLCTSSNHIKNFAKILKNLDTSAVARRIFVAHHINSLGLMVQWVKAGKGLTHLPPQPLKKKSEVIHSSNTLALCIFIIVGNTTLL